MTVLYANWILKASLVLAAAACASLDEVTPAGRTAVAPERRFTESDLLTPTPIAVPTLPPTHIPRPVPTVAVPDPDRTAWPRMMDRFQQKVAIADANLTGPVIGFHLDPKRVVFRVFYAPGRAQFISEWAVDLIQRGEKPLLIFPAGFFTAEHFALGLLVADGYRYGEAIGIGGVFVVQDGRPEIRWLEPQPVRPGESFDQAVQAFPVYVSRGVIPPLNEHQTRAPRTVIVETRAGDFIWLISPTDLFRTVDLARWLIDSDLEVYNALNLDGGRSAGYWAGNDDVLDSHVPLPAVIAVYAK